MKRWKLAMTRWGISYDGVIAGYETVEASHDRLDASSEAAMAGSDTLEVVFYGSEGSSRVLEAGRPAVASPHPGSFICQGLPGVVHALPAAGPAGNRASTVPPCARAVAGSARDDSPRPEAEECDAESACGKPAPRPGKDFLAAEGGIAPSVRIDCPGVTARMRARRLHHAGACTTPP